MRAGVVRAVREAVLLLVALALLVVGTDAAGRRQLPGVVPPDVVGYLLLGATVVALALRFRLPRTAFAAVVLLVAVYLGLGYPYGPVFLVAAALAYVFAAAVPSPVAAGGVGAAIVLWLVVQLPGVVAAAGWGGLLPLAGGYALCLVVPAWLATAWARARDAAAAVEERRRRELGELRLELAREVHDTVAHNLTVIGVQAGAARRVLHRDPVRAQECLDTVVATNRRALAEIRGTLDVLRTGAVPVDGGEGDLPALVASARAAGTPVAVTVTGDAHGAHTAVGRVAYLIARESLTNVMRHASGAHASVDLHYDPLQLTLRVRDDGPGLGGHPDGGGIRGMRERAEAVGGSLTVGAGTDGGVSVCAHLPLPEPAP